MTEDRLGYVKNRLDSINEVLEKLWELAESDDVVTPDEQNILEDVQKNLEIYKNLASQLLNGEEISDEELEKLYIFEKKIVQSASSEALNDGYVTQEEGDLLQFLLDFFTEMND